MRLDRELFSQLLTLFSILVGVGLQSQARLHPLWLPVPSAVPSSAQEGKVLPQFPQTICSSWIHETSPSAASAYSTTRAVCVQKMPLASLKDEAGVSLICLLPGGIMGFFREVPKSFLLLPFLQVLCIPVF